MAIDLSKLTLNFQPITTTVPVAGGAARGPAGGTMWESGRFLLNATGSEDWKGLCHDGGLDLSQIGAYFEADEENKVISVRPVIGAGKGIMPVRWSADMSTATLHLGGVFKEKPKLRIKSKRDISVAVAPDGKGNTCLLIFLQIALPKPKTRTAKSAGPGPVNNNTDNTEENTDAED